MRISQQRLTVIAAQTGFRAEIVEKVLQLLHLLQAVNTHPFLKGKLALKGGTALNLFVFDLSRLSVDIDLNYIGSPEKEDLEQDRPKIEKSIEAVCLREDFAIRRTPTAHAGGKWQLRYPSSLGQWGNLEVDVNYMFRVPLWDVQLSSGNPLGAYRLHDVPVLDIHELAAGKMAALFGRHQARDLFDVHGLLQSGRLDEQKLRMAFVTYGAMQRKDWRTISLDDIGFDPNELEKSLGPVLRRSTTDTIYERSSFANRLMEECKGLLSEVFPLKPDEHAFLKLINEKGVIEPSLLTDVEDLQNRISRHPMLQWKALNVRRHIGR